MAIIEKPLNVFEIADQLGYYEYAPHPVTGQTVRKVDVGRLCTHPNINMWAKYKPVRRKSVKQLTEEEMAYQPNVFSRYGIKITSDGTLTGLLEKIKYIDSVTHEYVRPNGGVNSPFRVADFWRYEHEGGNLPTTTGAQSRFDNEPTFNIGRAVDHNESVLMSYGGIEPMQTPYLLAKEDVYPPDAVYRGILLWYNEEYYWQTGTVDFNNIVFKSWIMGKSSIRVGAMQFMTDKKNEVLTTANNTKFATFYAITQSRGEPMNANPYNIILKKTGTERYELSATAQYNYTTNTVDYTLEFSANTANTIGGQLNDIEVVLLDMAQWKLINAHGSYNLLNNTVKTYNGSFNYQETGVLRIMVFERQKVRAGVDVIIQA